MHPLQKDDKKSVHRALAASREKAAWHGISCATSAGGVCGVTMG